MNPKFILSVIAGAVVLVFGYVFFPLVSVPAGHMGIVTVFGNAHEKPLTPGMHIVNPMAHVIDMDVRQHSYAVKGDVGTKDLQNVHGHVVVNYHVNPSTVTKLYTKFGSKFEDIIIYPAVQDRLKAVTPHFNAEELVTKRADVSRQIKDAITEAVTSRSEGTLVVDDVVVADFGFAKSFMEAIENKQVAEQLALKAERDLQRIRVEAEQQIAAAKAQAESYRLQSQQITPQMIQMESIKKWDGKLPAYLGSGAPIPFMSAPPIPLK